MNYINDKWVSWISSDFSFFFFVFFFFCPLNAAQMLRKAVAGLLKLDMIIVDAG